MIDRKSITENGLAIPDITFNVKDITVKKQKPTRPHCYYREYIPKIPVAKWETK
jgi:hypothetical protein